MSVFKDIHGQLTPFLTNQDFINLTNPNLRSEVALWIKTLESKYQLTSLNRTTNLGGDVILTKENLNKLKVFLKPELAKKLIKTRAAILIYDSNIFDVESACVKWNFSSGVYHVIKRQYLMQTIIPTKGGNPVLVINVGELGRLLQLGVDHPQYLDRVINHELVHCTQVANKELYSLKGKLYYKDKEIKPFDGQETKEEILNYQINLPYEIEAYSTQLEGLFTNYSEVFDIMNNIKT